MANTVAKEMIGSSLVAHRRRCSQGAPFVLGPGCIRAVVLTTEMASARCTDRRAKDVPV